MSSVPFSAFRAVFEAMSAESWSMESLPVVMASDLSLVFSLQKQANLS